MTGGAGMAGEGFDHLILDWNGTLIDEIGLAVECVNQAGLPCGVPPVTEVDYRRHFGFPIKRFYEALGFDFARFSFEETMAAYLGGFNARVGDCTLHKGAPELIQAARRAGMTISILSASHTDILLKTLHRHHLGDAFDHVFGLSDEAAAGKTAIARRLDAALGEPGRRALLVGDTDHDLEVAEACGWHAVAVTHGHQATDRFDRARADLFGGLRDVVALCASRRGDVDNVPSKCAGAGGER
jgi:phosphoglycolate phosphatase